MPGLEQVFYPRNTLITGNLKNTEISTPTSPAYLRKTEGCKVLHHIEDRLGGEI
jgi:hypothetical protein